MPKKKHEAEELTKEEVEEQNGEQLPDREVMSVINPGVDGIASGPSLSKGHRQSPTDASLSEEGRLAAALLCACA